VFPEESAVGGRWGLPFGALQANFSDTAFPNRAAIHTGLPDSGNLPASSTSLTRQEFAEERGDPGS